MGNLLFFFLCIKPVKSSIGIKKTQYFSSIQRKSVLFFQKESVFQGQPVLNYVLEREWKKPVKDMGCHHKTVYKADPSELEKWDVPGKVDSALQSFPCKVFSLQMTVLSSETLWIARQIHLYRYQLLFYLMAVPVAKALCIWLSHLGRDIQYIPRKVLLDEASMLMLSAEFICDFPLDVQFILSQS